MFLLPKDSYEVKLLKDKGRGVFATKEIAAGTVIGDYIGKIIPHEEDEEETFGGIYGTWRNDTETIQAIPSQEGVHFINHSCEPNCDVFPYQGHNLFFALRRIFPGEELTFHYLLEPHDNNGTEICIHTCFCHSELCTGSWHGSQQSFNAYYDFYKKMQGEYLDKQIVPFGEILPALDEYPKSIDDYDIYNIFGAPKESPIEMEEKALPSAAELRKLIRETGKRLHFSPLNYLLYGFYPSGLIVGKRT